MDEIIISTSQEYFLPEQNLIVSQMMVSDFDDVLGSLKRDNGIRRGEHVILQEKTARLHKFSSRFQHSQPDGTNGHWSWCARHDDPATVQVLKTWKWTGKKWVEVN